MLGPLVMIFLSEFFLLFYLYCLKAKCNCRAVVFIISWSALLCTVILVIHQRNTETINVSIRVSPSTELKSIGTDYAAGSFH